MYKLFIFVAIGGFFGAICRYALIEKIKKHHSFSLPLHTLFVNLNGSFLLGFLWGLSIKSEYYLMLGVGFMGAYTTFSTFIIESVQLFKSGKRKVFVTYLLGTTVGGIVFAWLGTNIAKMFLT